MTDCRTAGPMRLALKGGTAAHLTGTTPVASTAEQQGRHSIVTVRIRPS